MALGGRRYGGGISILRAVFTFELHGKVKRSPSSILATNSSSTKGTSYLQMTAAILAWLSMMSWAHVTLLKMRHHDVDGGFSISATHGATTSRLSVLSMFDSRGRDLLRGIDLGDCGDEEAKRGLVERDGSVRFRCVTGLGLSNQREDPSCL